MVYLLNMVIFHGYASHNQMVIGELLKHQISPVKKHKMVPSHGITTSAAEMASLVAWCDESWLNPVRLVIPGWMVKLSKTHDIIGQPSNQEPRIVGPTCNVIRWDYINIEPIYIQCYLCDRKMAPDHRNTETGHPEFIIDVQFMCTLQ